MLQISQLGLSRARIRTLFCLTLKSKLLSFSICVVKVEGGRDFPGGPVVRFCTPNARARVRSPIRELRSRMLHTMRPKEDLKNKNKIKKRAALGTVNFPVLEILTSDWDFSF